MRVGVNVPGHGGAGREGVDLDVHFFVRLTGKIGDKKLLGLDLARSLSLTTTLATTMVVMRAFVGIMAGPPLPGHSLTCIAHPAWPFLARQSRRVGKAKRAHHCLRVGTATPLPTLQTRSE